MGSRLSKSELLKLRNLSTPTIYNGWEQITKHDVTKGLFNMEETKDFMPELGPMVGYAVTVVIEPSNPEHAKNKPQKVREYREYVASVPGPKIVVVQDLDKPAITGSFWGEVNSNVHRSLGCVGTIVDGGIRDIDEMKKANFKALCRRPCVGHAHVTPVRWNCEVEVFGTKVKPGQLIHADQHGFMVIPEEDEKHLLEAATFMDDNEFSTVIPAGWNTVGKTTYEIIEDLTEAGKVFSERTKSKFSKLGEW